MQFTQQFTAARRVSTPLVTVQTFDAKSSINGVRKTLKENDKSALLLWDAVHGLKPLNDSGTEELAAILNGVSPEATISLVETLRLSESCTQDVIIFLSNTHLLWSEPTVIQAIWNLRDGFKANGNMLVMLCTPGAKLPAELVNDVLVLEEPLPTPSELGQTIEDTFKFAKKKAPSEAVMSKAVDALIGLPAFPAEQSTAMCLDMSTGTLNVKDLWDRKRTIISQTPGLSVYSGKASTKNIGGVENAKGFLSSVFAGIDPPKVILRMDEIEKAFAGTGTDTSGVKTELTGSMLSWMQDTEMDGMIFIGLPGVSKSELIYAYGNEAAVPVINFDLAAMQDKHVGTSGANLRAAQKTVDAISGGKVLAIATCNSINALPPELRRRFNLGIFFFDAPNAEERASIWNIYRTAYQISKEQSTPIDAGWTGAEIKECCKKAHRFRMSLAQAAQYVVPVTVSAADQINALRLQSSGKYLSATKPGVYRFSSTDVEKPAAVPTPEASGRRIRNNELN